MINIYVPLSIALSGPLSFDIEDEAYIFAFSSNGWLQSSERKKCYQFTIKYLKKDMK